MTKEERKEYDKQYYILNKDKIKKYYKKNKEELNAKSREYYRKNREKFLLNCKKKYEKDKEEIKAWQKNNYQKNKEKILIQKKEYSDKTKDKRAEYYRKNKEKKLAYNKQYVNNKYKFNDEFKITTIIRNSFRHYIKLYSKSGKIKSVFKYGIDIKAIVEKLGTPPNDGKVYHIDHIFPVSAFDLNNPEHIKLCWAPENLRWLEANENLSKSNKYDLNEFQEYVNQSYLTYNLLHKLEY